MLRTDHSSLRWLYNFKEPEGQTARWLEQLASFEYEILHRPGKLHQNADAVSWRPSSNQVEVHVEEVRATSEAVPQEDAPWDLAAAQLQDSTLQQLRQWKEGIEKLPTTTAP